MKRRTFLQHVSLAASAGALPARAVAASPVGSPTIARGPELSDAELRGLVQRAVDAARMYAAGADVVAIRTAIDRKWTGRFPSSTPTPKPPAHQH